MNLTIKAYDIDYSFIIKNYLDKELWDKEWTLFVYKDFVFKIRLSKIDTRDKSIEFELLLAHNGFEREEAFYYYLSNENLKILKKKINGCVFRLIERCEEYDYIREEEGYLTIKNGAVDEKNMLREIAEAFLDEEGVTNRDIRDVYIDNYVENNKRTDAYLLNYTEGRKYKVLSDLYLLYAQVCEDEDRYQAYLSKIKNEYNYEEVVNMVQEYYKKIREEDEELISKFQNCLEAV